MIWYKHLYKSPGLIISKASIEKRIKERRPILHLHFIILSQNPEESLEIVPSEVMMQKMFDIEQLYIIGVASRKELAFELVRKIVDDIYKKTGHVQVRAYFEQNSPLKEVRNS